MTCYKNEFSNSNVWSAVISGDPWITQKKKLIVSGRRMRNLGCCITRTLLVILPSLWSGFWLTHVCQWFHSAFTWSESVWLLPFLTVQITSQKLYYHFNTVDDISNRLRQTSEDSFRLSILLPEVEAKSPMLLKESILKRIMLNCNLIVNKKILYYQFYYFLDKPRIQKYVI